MSAYGHQMEHEYSAERLSSLAGSERESSSYVMESGFHITSFAATIFIASLATFGVSLVTLLIALTVMLRSCESRSAGVVESPISGYDYKTFSLLNNLEATQIPVICTVLDTQYVENGQYARDLNSTMWLVENYLGSLYLQDDALDVFLLDVDDVLSPNSPLQRSNEHGRGDCVGVARYLKHLIIIGIYAKLHSSGWPVILFSRKPERQRNMAIENLHSAGFTHWYSFIMRFEDEMDMDSMVFLSRRRAVLKKQGFRIRAIISSHFDALSGPTSPGLVFKLPNPIYCNFGKQNQATVTPA